MLRPSNDLLSIDYNQPHYNRRIGLALHSLKKAPVILFLIFFVCYCFALFIFFVGEFGLFGANRDPLAGVYLIPLGWPWNRLLDLFGEAARPWLGLLSPLINLIVLFLLVHLTRQK